MPAITAGGCIASASLFALSRVLPVVTQAPPTGSTTINVGFTPTTSKRRLTASPLLAGDALPMAGLGIAPSPSADETEGSRRSAGPSSQLVPTVLYLPHSNS